MIKDPDQLTPMMRQYFEVKSQYPDTLVFYRLGDFFELFFDDAKIISELLDLTLTRRGTVNGEPLPMAGVPFHTAETYIARLLKMGRSVVICDQVGERGKGMMTRKVTRIITPGTVTDDAMLTEKQENVIAAIYEDKLGFGFATLSISSGRFTSTEISSADDLLLYLDKVNPSELLYPERFTHHAKINHIIAKKALSTYDFDYESCYNELCNQFQTKSLIGFGLDGLKSAICAAGALLKYVRSTQNVDIAHVTSISRYESSSIVIMDKNAQRNLELLSTLSGNTQGSLISVIDDTKTPMGARLLRNMLLNPSRNNTDIANRHDLVEALMHNPHSDNLSDILAAIGDIERIVARLGLRSSKPRDLSKLRDSISLLPVLKNILKANWQDSTALSTLNALNQLKSNMSGMLDSEAGPSATDGIADGSAANTAEGNANQLTVGGPKASHAANTAGSTADSSYENSTLADSSTLGENTDCDDSQELPDGSIADIDNTDEANLERYIKLLTAKADLLPDLSEVYELLSKAIADFPNLLLRDGGVIAPNYSKELDELRDLQNGSANTLQEIENREKARTGIPNLKVNFNNVHGYYIELSKSYADRAPQEYIRRQTLKNAERFITPELKELEEKTLSAKTRSLQLEKELFDDLLEKLMQSLPNLSSFAHNVAMLDVMLSLARIAKKRHYVRPTLSKTSEIKIVAGRHPVVEAMSDTPFISNGITLNADKTLAVISGPNMGGKSTFMRQIALIAIMARIGSFVPANEAVIGDIDRIFTRIGASDDLSSGRSTFMVEMEESATILNNATKKSLVIMDEVGRGTSGAEGAAIAEAIVQYLAKDLKPKTLFATHYSEVTTLIENYSNAFNLCFNASEFQGKIVFLYHAEPGRQTRSFGIEVAQLAGVPSKITKRAIGFYSARTKELDSVNLFTPPLVSHGAFSSLDHETDAHHEGDTNEIKALKHELNELKTILNKKNAEVMELKSQSAALENDLAHQQAVIKRIRELDINSLSPLNALTLLHELSEGLKKNS